MINEFINSGSKVIYGKEKQFRLALCALIAEGHILVEDPPGMGKTTFVKTLAQLLGLHMTRIQFTNDLLPADVLGTSIYEPSTQQFVFKPGPIFSEVILGDELNRASPRTQSAFLQAMEEHCVSTDGKTHELPNPFFIIATQNPFDHAGVYPLPESQLDRFLICISLGYPDSEHELNLLKLGDSNAKIESLSKVADKKQLLEWQRQVREVHASEDLLNYVLRILQKSRMTNKEGGFSPRAGLGLVAAAKAWAYIDKRDFVLPEDIKALAPYVLAHRLNQAISKTEAHARIKDLIEATEIP